MNYRKRTLESLNGKDVFPVPTDVLEGFIHPSLEEKIFEKFNIEERNHDSILKKLNAHFRWAVPLYIGPPLEEGNFKIPPAWPFKKITKSIWGTWDGIQSYTGTIERPLDTAETISDIDRHNWPEANLFDYHRIGTWGTDSDSFLIPSEWAKVNKDYTRAVGGFLPIFCTILDLFGMDKGLLHVASRPDLIKATVRYISVFLEEYYESLANATSGFVDILAFGDDFGSQNGLLLDPQKWREYFLPTWKRLFNIAHKYGMKTQMHMCGSIRPVLGDLIDAGLDIYEIVQVTAKDMEPKGLKKDFGKDLAFYGGIDVQKLLRFGSIAKVRDEVRKTIDILGKNGKYILCSTHALTEDMPVDNVIAMYDEAQIYRR